jgi:hypothetical protein
MAVFPNIAPIHSLNKTVSPLVSKTRLGDGYIAFHQLGLNSTRSEWQLEWLVDFTDATTIDTFLRTRANAEEFFEWQPPDSLTALRFRCEEWTVEEDTETVYRVNATFKRVFETASYSLSPSAADCIGDELCETDYGNSNYADFWMSRIISPLTDLDPQTYSVDRIEGHKIVMDSTGNSYSVYIHRTPAMFFPVATPSAYWYLVITKRDIGGNIIWSKRTSMSIAAVTLYGIFIGDLSDGYGNSLVVIGNTASSMTGAGFWNYETWLMTFSLNGGFRRAYTTPIPGAGNLRLSTITNNLLFAATDPGAVANYMHVIKPQDGSLVTSYWIRQPGTIYGSGDIGTDTQLIEMSSTRSLFFANLGGNRIHVTRVNNGVPETTALFQSIPYTFSGSGTSITACKYENTVLLFNYRYIYQYNIDGELIRILNIPGGYILGGVDGIKLDKENDNIYLGLGPSVATIDYGLTTLKTITNMTPSGNSYSGRNGTQQGGGNMLNLQGNRYVVSMDTYAGYGQSATGGRGIFMLGGARLSEVGLYKTMAVSGNSGTYNAGIQGISVYQAITETALSYVNRYTVSNMMVWQYYASTSVSLRTLTMSDCTDTYVYNLFDTQFG